MCVVNILNKGKQIWKPKGKLSDNSLNKTKQIWQPKGKLSDNSLNKTKQVWKATGKLFANVGYQWRPTGKKFTSGKLNCGYQWRPTGKKFALGELCPLTRLPVTCGTDHPLVSGLRLFKTRFRGRNGSCTHQFRTRAYDDVWTKQFKPRSSSNDVCSNQFRPHSLILTLSADLLRKALNVTPADSAHPFESPPAGTQMSLEVSQAYGQAHVNRVAIRKPAP
ncbi:hypothetical protein Tco_1158310 [Tanacetum coccineum]